MANAPITKFSVLPPRPLDQASSLGGWWTFDNTFDDFSGGGALPTAVTNVTFVPGIIGQAASFDGSTSFVQMASGLLNQYTNGQCGISFSGWIKGSAFTNAYNTIFARNSSATTFIVGYVKSNGKLAFYVDDGVTQRSIDGTGANTLVTGVWYHVAFINNAGAFGVYVNGQVDSLTGSGGIPAGSVVPTITFGKDPQFAGRTWAGLIDDARWYNWALTQAQINAIYNQGLAFQQGQPEQDFPVLRLSIASTDLAGNIGTPSHYGKLSYGLKKYSRISAFAPIFSGDLSLVPVVNLSGGLTPTIVFAADLDVHANLVMLRGDLAPQIVLGGALSLDVTLDSLEGSFGFQAVYGDAEMISGPLWADAEPCPSTPWGPSEPCPPSMWTPVGPCAPVAWKKSTLCNG